MANTILAASTSRNAGSFFKIDYYDLRLEFGSDDPADSAKAVRVLTLIPAEGY